MRKQLTIIYKSGVKVHISADVFTVRMSAGTVNRITYEGLEPKVLHMGVDEIAAIWNGHL